MTQKKKQTQSWLLGGFIERMACCTVPTNDAVLMTDMVVSWDEDDHVDRREATDHHLTLPVSSSNRRMAAPSIGSLPSRPLQSRTGLPNDLPSPALSPSRRQLDPCANHTTSVPATPADTAWDTQQAPLSTPSQPERESSHSVATTASIHSTDEESGPGTNFAMEEIRSNATTQVISHRKQQRLYPQEQKQARLVQTLLASAEEKMKERKETQHEESAYQLLMKHQQHYPQLPS